MKIKAYEPYTRITSCCQKKLNPKSIKTDQTQIKKMTQKTGTKNK